MSTGTLARPRQTVHGSSALIAIARFEARKIWRHPALILATLVTAYELYQQVAWANAPVLNRDSYTSAWPMVIYAAGVYLAIGMTVNRRHGAQEDETMDAVPVSPTTRIMGTGLAFVSPLVVAVLMQGGVLLARALDAPATSIVWAEALVGPVTVALGAAAGMAVGWVFKTPLAVPLAGVGFLGATLVVWWNDFIFGYYTPWLASVPSLDRNQSVFEQGYRPSELHLVYLALMTALFVVVATVRGRRSRGRVISIGGSVLLLAAVFWVGSVQLQGLTPAEEADWEARYLPASGDYICEQRATVTYCAYRGYEVWIDDWAAEVEPVLHLVPAEVAARPLEIRQQVPYFVDEDELPPTGDLTAGMWWSRRAYDDTLVAHRFGMALAAAGWALDFPTRLLDVAQFFGCSSHDQGRAVAALWYAVQSSPESLEALEFQVSGERFGGLSPQDNVRLDIGFRQPASTVTYFRREAVVALELNERPVEDVAATFATQWSELTDAGTTTKDVAAWFAVDVPNMGPPFDLDTSPCP